MKWQKVNFSLLQINLAAKKGDLNQKTLFLSHITLNDINFREILKYYLKNVQFLPTSECSIYIMVRLSF